MNQYDALFIIDPDKESALKEVTDAITESIVKASGKVSSEENWGKQRLSYAVKKHREGIYYKLNFSADPSQISNLNSAYKLNPNILRVMITKR